MARSLEAFVEEVNGTSHLRVEHDFGGGFVRLRTSEAERRQAIQDIRCSESIVLELLRNARDAHATMIYVAMSREGSKRELTVIDNGDGIPTAMHEHVFEPRVTSKLDTSHIDTWGMHGRGMALYSIGVNAERAYIANSDTELGCALHVETDVSKLSEKADQSSFPTFTLGEDNTVAVRGPRNILRTACEFAIDSRATCAVYVGSPAEVVASLYEYGASSLSALDRAFCKDPSQLPIVKRFATAPDPETLSALASSCGLAVSERTARRVMNGEVAPLEPILDLVEIRSATDQRNTVGSKRSKSSVSTVKLGKDDVVLLKNALKNAFETVADRYYLEGDVDPSVRIVRDRVVVSLPIVRKS